ncbi:MAG: CRISPR-associated endonuclease Cas2 [Patescibacteria group bacterium]|jgi:phenylacetic acid degradation operon negative regulatory protein
MPLSPMQEIFILLEDEKKVPLFRLNRWGRKTRGVLAKLKKMDWVEKVSENDEVYYQITQKGEKEFDKTLKSLKATGTWDGRWRLVMFDIPESKRDVRDRLRRALNKLGLGILQASVWISPNNIKDEVAEIGKKLDLQTSLKFFEVTRNKTLDKTIIEKSWNLPELVDLYRQFNLEVSRVLKMIDKTSNPNFAIKKLIFEYALILQKDPILPFEFREKDDLRKTAHENYLAIKKYLV